MSKESWLKKAKNIDQSEQADRPKFDIWQNKKEGNVLIGKVKGDIVWDVPADNKEGKTSFMNVYDYEKNKNWTVFLTHKVLRQKVEELEIGKDSEIFIKALGKVQTEDKKGEYFNFDVRKNEENNSVKKNEQEVNSCQRKK